MGRPGRRRLVRRPVSEPDPAGRAPLRFRRARRVDRGTRGDRLRMGDFLGGGVYHGARGAPIGGPGRVALRGNFQSCAVRARPAPACGLLSLGAARHGRLHFFHGPRANAGARLACKLRVRRVPRVCTDGGPALPGGDRASAAAHASRCVPRSMSAAFWLMLAVFIGIALLRGPIGLAMIAGGIAYLGASGQDMGLAAEQILNSLFGSFVLIAVPMFIFAANVMNAGTITERIFALAHALVGRFRGGLAHINVLVSVIFAGMSGSAIADAVGPGMVEIEMMSKGGRYPKAFAVAVSAAAATIGPIIPPSIPMVLYALVSGTSVGALFLGGVVPGLLMAAAMSLVIVWVARRRKFPTEASVPWSAFPRILARSLLPVLMPVVLLGGIYSGVYSSEEHDRHQHRQQRTRQDARKCRPRYARLGRELPAPGDPDDH